MYSVRAGAERRLEGTAEMAEAERHVLRHFAHLRRTRDTLAQVALDLSLLPRSEAAARARRRDRGGSGEQRCQLQGRRPSRFGTLLDGAADVIEDADRLGGQPDVTETLRHRMPGGGGDLVGDESLVHRRRSFLKNSIDGHPGTTGCRHCSARDDAGRVRERNSARLPLDLLRPAIGLAVAGKLRELPGDRAGRTGPRPLDHGIERYHRVGLRLQGGRVDSEVHDRLHRAFHCGERGRRQQRFSQMRSV